MKIIFLDIDGVFNSDLWNSRHKKEIESGILIDEKKIKLLSNLIKSTEAKIVLHSGWRFWFDKNTLLPVRKESVILSEMFKNNGIEIYDFTPDLTTEEIKKNKNFSIVKADEILLWLKTHMNIASWIVIDDLDLNNHAISERQIRPDKKYGITENDILKAEKLFK